MAYNGWKNYATWNVALWIGNEEPLYQAAVEFMRGSCYHVPYKGRAPYAAFVRRYGFSDSRTPDNVKWLGSKLAYSELNAMMRELT